MKRREFISLFGGAAAAWPLAVRAQQNQIRRVGVLMTNTEKDPEPQAWTSAFEAGLNGLGWVLDRDLRIEYRWGENDPQRLRIYAAELVGMAPDVIFAGAAPALVALHRETRSIPIVFTQISDPVKLGFVASLARPGGNITGFANFEHPIAGKWLDLLKDTAPNTTRVGIVLDPDNLTQAVYLQAIEAAAPSFRFKVIRIDVRSAAEIESAINAFAQQSNGALLVLPTTITTTHRDLIVALTARHRILAIYPYRFFATSGGFISYGVDLPHLYRQAASYVDRILKGAKAGDLPVQLASKFELVVNLKAAKALGLTIPEPFLQLADKVIE